MAATWYVLYFARETEHIEGRKSACALKLRSHTGHVSSFWIGFPSGIIRYSFGCFVFAFVLVCCWFLVVCLVCWVCLFVFVVCFVFLVFLLGLHTGLRTGPLPVWLSTIDSLPRSIHLLLRRTSTWRHEGVLSSFWTAGFMKAMDILAGDFGFRSFSLDVYYIDSSPREPRFVLVPLRFASEAWPRAGLGEPRSGHRMPTNLLHHGP